MADDNNVAVPVAAFAKFYIERHGVAIARLPPGKKYPTGDAWQMPYDAEECTEGYITDAAQAFEFYTKNPKWGIGAVLGPSRLCSLDIDNLEESRVIFSEFGIDIDAMADEYPAVVGNPARFRIMFRAPEGFDLTTHQLRWPDKTGDKRHVVFELRGSVGQDVLPPTIHPDFNKPYTWRTKPGATFPQLPEALLTIWQQWDIFKDNAASLCPWATDVKRPPAAPTKPRQEGEASAIEAYCAAHGIHEALAHYGYKRMGKRYLSPHSKTKLPGVVILEGNRAWIHHASDPLGGERPVNPFDLFLHYEHNDDLGRATKAAAKVMGIAHKTREELRAERQAERQAPQEELPPHDPETGEIYEPTQAPKEAVSNEPFTALGFDKGTYFYLAAGTQQVVSLSPSAHTKLNLLQLAPRVHWEREYPDRNGADWEAAADHLMRLCERRGVFSPSIMRGRGAWYDAGRIVVHLGDRVLVDGSPSRPGRVASRFVYEAGVPMQADISSPLTAAEASQYLKLLEKLSWKDPMSGALAAGWCVVAHIGGVMSWRPHIWVVGGRGAGKTYAVSKVLRPVLGDNVLHAQGDTSEAGLRQTLGLDSLPVVFDEAEGQDKNANDRIQAILSLVRQSSSDTGGKILKGTTGGRAMRFDVRSCFAFSSINANLVQQSDRSRVTVLELVARNDAAAFADIEKTVADLLTDEYAGRFYARSLTMAATIRANARAFAAAAATVLGEQRAGDQIGALLAGAYSLTSDKAVTAVEAEAWVSAQDWTAQRDEVQSQSDEGALWQHIIEQRIRVNGGHEFSVGQLIERAVTPAEHDAIVTQPTARETLASYGLKVTDDGAAMLVSNNHAQIKRLMAGTPWPVNWGKVLQRLPGAEAYAKAVYFCGSTSKAVRIPINVPKPAATAPTDW